MKTFGKETNMGRKLLFLHRSVGVQPGSAQHIL